MTESAVLGGGCFWCLEAVFESLAGVERVESGYAGGVTPNPVYDQVCTGRTGHAEVVRISFDPAVVSFDALLEVFFHLHDPTTPNRQGADVGTQYRSVIYYRDEQQKRAAEQAIAKFDAAKLWPAKIVTELSPLETFYEAEEHHQGYFRGNSAQPYCSMVIVPKLQKLRSKFGTKLKRA